MEELLRTRKCCLAFLLGPSDSCSYSYLRGITKGLPGFGFQKWIMCVMVNDSTSPVQSSPSNFWTGIGPIPNFSGPGLNWSGLLWTCPFGPNRPEYAGSY